MNNSGIDYVFHLHPELALVGDKVQYEAYLATIFPDSQLQGIHYHGTRNPVTDKIEIFDMVKTGKHTGHARPKGFYFTDDITIAEQGYTYVYDVNEYGFDYPVEQVGYVVPAILNISKIEFDVNNFMEQDDIVGVPTIYESFVVFNPEDVHVLGSPADQLNFKAYTEKVYAT